MSENGDKPKRRIGQRFVDADELGEILGVCARTLSRMVERGEFPQPVPVTGRMKRWAGWEVEDWIQKRLQARSQ